MVYPQNSINRELATGFSIIHSNRLENLRDVAVRWVKKYPLAPLENEIFIVQSNGMAQWLKLGLADDDGCGISAATDFQLPARFLWNVYRATLGSDQVPEESPFDKNQMTWRLFRIIPRVVTNSCFKPLQGYLADDDALRKRYQLACHLADLYDQYQVYRADWIEDWTAGSDQIRDGQGHPSPLPEKQSWQAELWRNLQTDVPADLRQKSRSMLHRHFLQTAVKSTRRPPLLPRRVIVFGVSSLPQQALEALDAISKFCQVLMFVHNPCRYYWADIIEDRELLKIMRARHQRKNRSAQNIEPDTLHQHVNPLLAAWGKQGRDFIGLLYGYDRPEAYRSHFDEIDLFTDVAPPGSPTSLLQQVQQAVLNLAQLPSTPKNKQPVAASDQSVTFQLAHSRQREVEILHDQLLSFFQSMPGLRPRDIIVMTPDIDLYAPHIDAVFGNLEKKDPRFIPFTIADHSQYTNVPMLFAVEKLLHLPVLRFTAGDIFDLLEVSAFCEKFGLTPPDIPKLRQWIEESGIRWGIDGEQRTQFDLTSPFEENSWMFGLRRMLLGYAVGSGAPWQGIEPYDEIGGTDAAIVGPLYLILTKLEQYRRLFAQPTSPSKWHSRLSALMEDFFQPTGMHEEIIQERISEILDQWIETCQKAQLNEALPLTVVRDAIVGPLKESSVSQRFLAGMVNFCTLMPMRAIPFKIVCLLGMNDGEYPRSIPPVDFDLMSSPSCYRPGDRSRREDDRYLFLEALLSARDKLYISYIGRSIRDNSPCMPSVLVVQLQDYLVKGWQPASPETEKNILEQLICRHPLQPFSKSYFGIESPPGVFTFSKEWEPAVDAVRSKIHTTPLDPPQFEGRLQLLPLIGFLKNPTQHFFNRRLAVFFDDLTVTAEDRESFTLDRQAPFNIGAGLLTAGLTAPPGERAQRVVEEGSRLLNKGAVPVGNLGRLAIAQLIKPVSAMIAKHDYLEHIWPAANPSIELKLPIKIDGCQCDVLEDWLDRLNRAEPEQAADTPHQGPYARWEFYYSDILDLRGGFAKLHPMLSLWVKHLAAGTQGVSLHSYLVTPDCIAEFKPLDPDQARNWLEQILRFWWMGLTLPLPVTAKSALAFLKALNAEPLDKGRDALVQKAHEAARKAYQGDGFRSNGELGTSRYLVRCYPDFDSLWTAGDHQFQQLAEVLYAPMIQSLSEKKEPQS